MRRFIDDVKPDVIVLGHWLNALPQALRHRRKLVIDAHNIESLLLADAYQVKRNTIGEVLSRWRYRRRERILFRKAKAIWLTSADDARELKKLDRKSRKPVIVPNAVDVQSYENVRNGNVELPTTLNGAKRVIGLVGLYAYPPNGQAAQTLIDIVFPAVAAAFDGDARLLLIGKEPTAAMVAASKRDSRIVVTGMVDDVRPYLALLDLVVVPLTEGGGTRVKIIEAFAAGVPVVSTAKGAEGIDAVNGRDIVIANTPRELADAAIALLRDDTRRAAQAHAALELVTEKYSWKSVSRDIARNLP